MTISEGGKGEQLCLEFRMKRSAEEIQRRIDNLRISGRPVPLILEATLMKMKRGKGPALPSFAKKGFSNTKRG